MAVNEATSPGEAAALDNVNVAAALPLPSPAALKAALPADSAAVATVAGARAAITEIIEGRDPRMLLVVGPCSIHDPAAARDYLARLRPLAAAVEDVILVVMRVYFEKPRTTVGWKGLINDPRLDDSFDLEGGLRLARTLLLELADAGMPAATEALDPIVPQYLGDLVSWYAIGARTTESQTHREMASGLSAPCGFKNGTDGEVTVAVQAMQSAGSPHAFLGIDGDGRPSVIRTRGNRETHVILRGGAEPNYDEGAVADCLDALAGAGLRAAVMVDASHGNSAKDPARQPGVAREVVRQRAAGNRALMGLMLESNIHAGKQAFGPPAALAYGVSITDGCIDFETTESLVKALAQTLRDADSPR